MQHALQFMREGTDSSQESRCRIALIRNGLPCPQVNWKVRLNNGKIVLLDMAYPDIKVAIEYDGRHQPANGSPTARDVKPWKTTVGHTFK